MKTNLLMLFMGFIFQTSPIYSQTADETITTLNKLFSEHNIGATNFSFKKISDSEIVATNSVAVTNYGAEKLTYRFNPKRALYVRSIVSKKNITVIFSFEENSVEWFDRYLRIETLNKIQCSLINMEKGDIDNLLRAYRHLINLLGGEIKE